MPCCGNFFLMIQYQGTEKNIKNFKYGIVVRLLSNI